MTGTIRESMRASERERERARKSERAREQELCAQKRARSSANVFWRKSERHLETQLTPRGARRNSRRALTNSFKARRKRSIL